MNSVNNRFDLLKKAYSTKLRQRATFKQLVSEISINKYSQEEYVDVINAIYEGVYEKKAN